MISKNIFLSTLSLIIGIVSLNAKDYLTTNSSTNLKIGIYKNFEEFKNNAPSIELNYDVLAKQLRTGGFVKGEKTTFYYLNISKQVAKKIGKVYGFSDGKNIFINEFNPNLKPKTLFMRVNFIEHYCIFEYKSFDKNLNSLLSKNKAIDMKTGKIKFIPKSTLTNLASTNKEFLLLGVNG